MSDAIFIFIIISSIKRLFNQPWKWDTLLCLCTIFDHLNSHTTVCLLCSREACRWNLEMTPCLNFIEVAQDALPVGGWHSLRVQTTYSFSVLKDVSQTLFVFCLDYTGLCCGPLTPPTGHPMGNACFSCIWGVASRRASIPQLGINWILSLRQPCFLIYLLWLEKKNNTFCAKV